MVKRLIPDTFVEVNDVINGGKKIAVVDETGLGYFDAMGDAELPKPLFDGLQPVSLGSIPSWLKACDQPVSAELHHAWDYCLSKGCDILTVARALRWSIENHATDPELLEAMGRAATDQVKQARSIVSKGLLA